MYFDAASKLQVTSYKLSLFSDSPKANGCLSGEFPVEKGVRVHALTEKEGKERREE